jgi:hypothetical protein
LDGSSKWKWVLLSPSSFPYFLLMLFLIFNLI